MENSKIVIGYLIYLPIVIFLTIYVSKALFKNGQIFMNDIFNGKEDIAKATNKLFEVGFYLVNLGWALLVLKISYKGIIDNQTLIEILSRKIGAFSIYLGAMLFINLYLFFRGRKKSKENNSIIKTTA